MKEICTITLIGAMAAGAGAQAITPPMAFEWDAPPVLTGIVGYRLQWGPDEFADMPAYQTLYEVENVPTGMRLPVSASSISSTTNSEPITIYVYNLNVLVEESEDLTNWQSIGSVVIQGQRKERSFLRLSLKPQ